MPGGQTVGEPSAAQVVRVRVHDHRAAEDVVRADQRDQWVLVRERGHASVVRLDVAQIASVSGLVLGTAVFVLRE